MDDALSVVERAFANPKVFLLATASMRQHQSTSGMQDEQLKEQSRRVEAMK